MGRGRAVLRGAGDTTGQERTNPSSYFERPRRESTEDGVTTLVDPVYGMPVTKENGILLEDETKRFWFCSEFCRQQYLRHPRAYEVGAPRSPQTVHWATRQVAYFSMEVALANDIPNADRAIVRILTGSVTR